LGVEFIAVGTNSDKDLWLLRSVGMLDTGETCKDSKVRGWSAMVLVKKAAEVHRKDGTEVFLLTRSMACGNG